MLRGKLIEFSAQLAERYQLIRWPAGSRELLTAVHQRKLAFALVHLPAQLPGVTAQEVFREKLGAVLPAHQFVGRESVSLTELADFTYIRTAKGTQPTYYDQLEVRMSAAGVHKRATLSTGDFASPAEVVSNGDAFSLTLLDQDLSSTSVNGAEVVALPFDDFNPELATGIIWRTDRAEEHADLHELIALLRDFFRSEPE
ncbi:LysR family transcriptional regulator substrate-binding protein [Psychromicrobium sp. YIM B11713]|uniref:LysR family transcriptional regulator substrate-binding protein n=1 Tax=Psychromicrobium sp. YIM B11713 TaxID=3145233 RepID=UPI00374FB7E0